MMEGKGGGGESDSVTEKKKKGGEGEEEEKSIKGVMKTIPKFSSSMLMEER